MGSTPSTAAGSEAEDGAPSRAGCASSQLRAAPRQDEAISCPALGAVETQRKREKLRLGQEKR